MGKASSTKKVARAASTGGGRTKGGRTPWLWYVTVALTVALGVAGVVQSRHQREVKLAAGTSVAPRLANPAKHRSFDHWHTAYGFYLCDHFAPNLADDAKAGGIHTHADGLIHVEPQVTADAGANATLGRFLSLAKVTATADEIQLPGDRAYKSGTKCGDKAGLVQVAVDGKISEGDPRKIRLKDHQHIVVAFAPKGATIPEPPSVANLSNPNAGEGATPPASATGTPAPTTPEGTPAPTTPGAPPATALTPGPSTPSAPAPTAPGPVPAPASPVTNAP